MTAPTCLTISTCLLRRLHLTMPWIQQRNNRLLHRLFLWLRQLPWRTIGCHWPSPANSCCLPVMSWICLAWRVGINSASTLR
jgi:hypothetical protein